MLLNNLSTKNFLIMKNDKKVVRKGTLARKVTLATGVVVMTARLDECI
jgi:hypothetical protein